MFSEREEKIMLSGLRTMIAVSDTADTLAEMLYKFSRGKVSIEEVDILLSEYGYLEEGEWIE